MLVCSCAFVVCTVTLQYRACIVMHVLIVALKLPYTRVLSGRWGAL